MTAPAPHRRLGRTDAVVLGAGSMRGAAVAALGSLPGGLLALARPGFAMAGHNRITVTMTRPEAPHFSGWAAMISVSGAVGRHTQPC